MTESAHKTHYLADYTPPPYWIDDVFLTFTLDRAQTRVRAVYEIRKHPDASNADLTLDGHGLTLDAVFVDEKQLRPEDYTLTSETLTLHHLPERATLRIDTLIHPDKNTALQGLYTSQSGLFTQCEAQGFSRITYYLDRPDVLATFKTKLIADKQHFPVLLSNGNLIESGELPGGHHFTLWEDPFKKPCYLFALVAADLVGVQDSFVTHSGRTIALEMYVQPRDKNKTNHALASLKRAMAWDEQTYDREYDLDRYMIVAVDDFNMGAMENKGLNIFNTECVLANDAVSTDRDYEWIEAVVGHEYFHNWTGNRITCRDWFQLCLKEGLTVFREQSFMGSRTTPGLARIEEANLLRSRQFAEDQGPLSHPVRPEAYEEINNFYTLTVYHKGAEIYRMLYNLLGEAVFKQCMQAYFKSFDGQAVTMEDLIRCFEKQSGEDLAQFSLWYKQAGTPYVSATGTYQPEKNTYTVRLTQTTKGPHTQSHKPFCIPVAMGLLDETGQAIPLKLSTDAVPVESTTRTLVLTQASQSFTFTEVPVEPTPSYLRHFSAPVGFETDLSEMDLNFLFKHDSDDFNRWDAGQQVFTQRILAFVEAGGGAPEALCPEWLIESFHAILDDTQCHPAIRAACVTLPTFAYLSSRMEPVTVDPLLDALDLFEKTLADNLKSHWLSAYHAHRASGEDMVLARARRRMKHRALQYLVASGDTDMMTLAYTQFKEAQTMTDRLSALEALSHLDTPMSQQAFDEFYTAWSHEPMVVNKWFSLQAKSKRKTVLETVQSLLKHPAFSIKNPNNVRALIGAFAEGNAHGFHAPDGSGYAFLAEQIAHIDTLNPQMASRLLNPFTSWKRYDTARQAQIKAHLAELAQLSLSKDSAEVVSKSLAVE